MTAPAVALATPVPLACLLMAICDAGAGPFGFDALAFVGRNLAGSLDWRLSRGPEGNPAIPSKWVVRPARGL